MNKAVTRSSMGRASLALISGAAMFVSTGAHATELHSESSTGVDKFSIDFQTLGGADARSSLSPGGGAVLAGRGTKSVATQGGSFAVSFSTGVKFNSTANPTQVTADGESQNIWSGSKTPTFIALSDKMTATGVSISPLIGGGVSSGISLGKDSITWSTSASGKKSIAHDWDNWKFNGAITRLVESATGSVTFGSTSYQYVLG